MLQKNFKNCVDVLYQQLILPNSGFKDDFNPNQPYVRAQEMMLNETSLIRFKSELHDLIEKYNNESKSFMNRSNKLPIGILVGLDSFSLWEKVMWDSHV